MRRIAESPEDYRPLCAYAEALVVRREFRRAEDSLKRALELLEVELVAVLDAADDEARRAERLERGLPDQPDDLGDGNFVSGSSSKKKTTRKRNNAGGRRKQGGGGRHGHDDDGDDGNDDDDDDDDNGRGQGGGGGRGSPDPEQQRMELLDRAEALRWEFGRVLQRLGTLAAMRQDFAEAEACFERAIAASPRDPSVLHAFGTLLERMREFGRAEQCYLQALTIDHMHVMSLQSYGTLLCDIQGNPGGARQYLDRAMTAAEVQWEEQPRDPSRVAALASVVRSYGIFLLVVDCDVPRAYQLLLRAVDTAPDDAQSWCKLATIHHHHRHDLDAAKVAYERCLGEDAVNHEALIGLAVLLITTRGRKWEGLDTGLDPSAAERARNPHMSTALVTTTTTTTGRLGKQRPTGSAGSRHTRNKHLTRGLSFEEAKQSRAREPLKPEVQDLIDSLMQRAMAARPRCPRTCLEYARFLDRAHRPPKLGQAEALLEQAVFLSSQGAAPAAVLGPVQHPSLNGGGGGGGGTGGGGGGDVLSASSSNNPHSAAAMHVESLLAFAQFVDYRRDDGDRAAALYGHLEALAPNDPDVLFARAQWTEGVRGDMRAAEGLYRRALERDPLHGPSLLGLANLLADMLGALTSGVDIDGGGDGDGDDGDGGSGEAKGGGGTALVVLGGADGSSMGAKPAGPIGGSRRRAALRDEATELYERAIQLAPEDAATARSLALFLHAVVGDHKRAASLFKRALRAEPNHVQTNTAYGLLMLYAFKDYERAERHLLRAVEWDPHHPEPYHHLGVLVEDVHGDQGRARQYYGHALEADPEHVPSLVRYGALITGRFRHHRGGGAAAAHPDVARAREYLSRAVAVSPDDADAHYYYARFLERPAGLSEAAAHHFQRCVELDEGHVLALQGLSELKLAQDDEAQAEELMVQALDVDPNDCPCPDDFTALLQGKEESRKLLYVLA